MYMNCKISLTYILIAIIPVISTAQDTLSLSTAIQLALENNYGIKVAELDYDISDNNVNPGNAGLLPRVSFTGNAGINANQVFDLTLNLAGDPSDPNAGPNVIDASGASNNQSASIGLTYTLFDGMNNINNFRILKATRFLSSAQARAVIENTLAQVISAYYQVARLTNSMRIQEQALATSRDRIARIENQLEFGSSNRLAALNAQVDLNTDSANLQTSRFNLENAQRDLNFLLGISMNDIQPVSQQTAFNDEIVLENMIEMAQTQNASLIAANRSLQVARLNEHVAGSTNYPTLDLSASYAYNRQENPETAFQQQQEILGFTGGLTLTYDIFNGFRRKINKQNAKIEVSKAEEQLDETAADLERNLSNAYNTYLNSLKIYELEQKSLEAALANFERTEESYKLGQSSQIEFRDAQLNLLRVRNRLNDLRFDIKLAEVELLRLSGNLVKEDGTSSP